MKLNYLFICTMLVMFSCGSDNSTAEATTDNSSDESSAAVSSSSCLGDYGTKPGDLFPLSSLVEMVGAPEAEVETSIGDKSKNTAYNYCQYNWNAGRSYMTKIGAAEIQVPVTNVVSVGFIKVIEEEDLKKLNATSNIEYFEKFYSTMTQTQKDSINNKIERKVEEQTKGNDGGLTNVIQEAVQNQKLIAIEGIGDRAVWEVNGVKGAKSIILCVLDGNTIFKVIVDVSENEEEDLEIAKNIANQLLNICA